MQIVYKNQQDAIQFYVYVYLDQNNVPFYIGKGFGDRFKIQSHKEG
jgi:hypothetical protein